MSNITKALMGAAGNGGGVEYFGDELNTLSDATAPAPNEANSVASWNQHSVAGQKSSVTSPADAQGGTYAAQIYKHSGGANNWSCGLPIVGDLSLSTGIPYRCAWRARHTGTADEVTLGVAPSLNGTADGSRTVELGPTDTTYTEYEEYFYTDSGDRSFFVVEETSGSNNGGALISVLSVKECLVANVDELNDGVDASSTVNEVNGAANWTTGNNCQVTSKTSFVDDGTYRLNFTSSTATANWYGEKDLSYYGATAGNWYAITLRARHSGAGSTIRIGLGAGSGNIEGVGAHAYNISVGSTTYTTYRFVANYDVHSHLIVKESSSTNNGQLYVDAVSVKQVNN